MQGDEDDWTMRYPSDLVGWLVDILESVEYRWSPVQVLETEALHPGLMADIGVELWQRRIITRQMETEKV